MGTQTSTKEWNKVLFSDCLQKVKIGREKQVKEKDYSKSGSYPIVDQGQSFIAGYTDDKNKVISNIQPFIIFGDHTRILKYIDFPIALGADGTKVIKPSEDFDTKFFFYYLKNIDLPSRGYNRHYTILKEKNIAHPSISEQRAIAQTLTTVQDAIAEQENLVTKLKELKRSMMQHLFTHGTKGEKTKMMEIGEIPESWEVVELIDVCNKPQYGYTDSASKSGNVRFLRITDITEDGVNWNTVPFCKCPEPEKYLLHDGDIVFARIGATTGKSFLLKDPDNAVYASYLIRVRTKAIYSDYLYHYFQTEAYWKQVDSQKGTNLKGGVNGSILSKLLVPKCSKEEQIKIANVLNTIDKNVKVTQAKLSSYQNLFRTLLQELMSGERRIKMLSEKVKEKVKRDPKEIFKDAFIQTYIIKNIPSPYVSHIRLEKTTYFTKRFMGVSPISTYETYTFGPYDPLNKHKGGLSLALNKKFIEEGDSWGYKTGRNAGQIKNYNYSSEVKSIKTVLENLVLKNDNELEILATTDFSIFKLLSDKIKPTAKLVLDFINSNEVWKEKIKRLKLDETKISLAMNELRNLINLGLPYPKL